MQKQILLRQQFDYGSNRNYFNLVKYTPANPTTNTLICLHGLGEIGPADGSKIDLVWRYGYPALAEAGFEFDFNLICPQVAADYYEIDKSFPSYVKHVLGASKIGVTGLSLGGRGTYSMLNYDRHKHIDFIVSVCGAAQVNDAFTMRDITGLAFHGDKDTTSGVAYSTDKGFTAAYNNFPGRQGRIEFITIPNYGHSIWGLCYDPNNQLYGQQVYTFVQAEFAKPVVPPISSGRTEAEIIEEFKLKVKNAIIDKETSFLDTI